MLAVNDWLLLIGVCALGAMTPGASLAVVTRHTLHGGHRAGAIAGVTHALGIGIWAAAKVFRIGILMTGKPPKLREILGWLRAPVGSTPVKGE